MIVFLVLNRKGRGTVIGWNIDAVINSVCMLLIHSSFDNTYHTMCGCADRMCHAWIVPRIEENVARDVVTAEEMKPHLTAVQSDPIN